MGFIPVSKVCLGLSKVRMTRLETCVCTFFYGFEIELELKRLIDESDGPQNISIQSVQYRNEYSILGFPVISRSVVQGTVWLYLPLFLA